MDDSWSRLDGVHERIAWARLNRTEFQRPTDAARSLGVRPGTYRTWELAKADGGRKPELGELQALARKYKVSWQWLATGRGSPDQAIEEDVWSIAAKLAQVSEDRRPDAIRAAGAVIESFRKVS